VQQGQEFQPKESFKSRLIRFLFNLFPCYRRTGVRITYIAPDVSVIKIKLPLNWKTRGYNGTIFGGSMYAAIDPVYMTMISWRLGRDFIAWDKNATIEFRKPGRTTLYATFRISPEQLEAIRTELESVDRTERVLDVALVDDQEVVHAAFTKTVQIRRRIRSTAPNVQV
jgi:hypothetical protein